MKTVHVLYSYGHEDESVRVLGAFWRKEDADRRLSELSAGDDGRLYYIQPAVLEDDENAKMQIRRIDEVAFSKMMQSGGVYYANGALYSEISDNLLAFEEHGRGGEVDSWWEVLR